MVFFEANNSFDDAMTKVAERLLLARIKQADAAQVARVNDARQELGVLGANPRRIDDAVSRIREGGSPTVAEDTIRGAVPGSGSQLANIPSSIGAAVRQGRIGDVASQLDVLGVKNVLPWSSYGSLPTAAASLGAGVGTEALRQHIAGNIKARQSIYHPDADALNRVAGSQSASQWDAWRASPAASGAEASYMQRVRDALLGPKLPTATLGMPTREQYQAAATEAATRAKAKSKEQAPSGKPAKPGGLGRAATAMAPAAIAAALPLLYREWAGRGYRSGAVPAQTLANVAATSRPPRQQETPTRANTENTPES
jgi:hypothetical protein